MWEWEWEWGGLWEWEWEWEWEKMKCGKLMFCGLRLIYRHITDTYGTYCPTLIYVAIACNRGLQTVIYRH